MLQWSHYCAHQVWQECSPGGQVLSTCSLHCCDARSPDSSQAHLYHGIFSVLCKDTVQNAWAEDVDLRVNLAMNVGKARGFFKKGDVVIVLTGWRPGSGFTNTMCVVPVPGAPLLAAVLSPSPSHLLGQQRL